MFLVTGNRPNKMPNRSFADLMGDRSQTNTRTKPFTTLSEECETRDDAERLALDFVEIRGCSFSTFEEVG